MARTLAQLDAAFDALLARVDAVAPVVATPVEPAPRVPTAVLVVGDTTYEAFGATLADLCVEVGVPEEEVAKFDDKATALTLAGG